MKIFHKLFIVMVLVLGPSFAAPAGAETKTDPEQAKAVALKAAALVKEQGVEAARPLFHAPGDYRFGEIYVNVIDTKGTWLIYPPKPEGEGKVVIAVKDPDGKLIVQDVLKIALEQGEGWVEYRWLNPLSGKIEPKVTFVKNVPERGAVVYVGVYK